jgi:hypothetical protein
MSISAALVKELRERTGAGMMECKRALVDTGGDIEAAVEHMRKQGLAKADKKAGRIAAEGLVVIASTPDHKTAAIVEVNCETDFVAGGDDFRSFAQRVGDTGAGAASGGHGRLAGPAAGCLHRRGNASQPDRQDRREHRRASLRDPQFRGHRRQLCAWHPHRRAGLDRGRRRRPGARPGDARRGVAARSTSTRARSPETSSPRSARS